MTATWAGQCWNPPLCRRACHEEKIFQQLHQSIFEKIPENCLVYKKAHKQYSSAAKNNFTPQCLECFTRNIF